MLEIGVGMGADHLEWARSAPRSLTGIDLTQRAIEHTRRRFEAHGLGSNIFRGNAERLPFADGSFDIVYSFGVLHHTPDTPRAVREVFRVLRPGGVARVMIYHTYSLTGYMLWARYGLLRGRPRTSLRDVYHHHLESPGTKAYSVREARAMFSDFSDVDVRVQAVLGGPAPGLGRAAASRAVADRGQGDLAPLHPEASLQGSRAVLADRGEEVKATTGERPRSSRGRRSDGRAAAPTPADSRPRPGPNRPDDRIPERTR